MYKFLLYISDHCFFFLEYMFYLSSNDINCPLPLKNGDNLFSEINGKPASLLTFLNGKSTVSVTDEQAYQLGLSFAF